jgi:hypothetical protein
VTVALGSALLLPLLEVDAGVPVLLPLLLLVGVSVVAPWRRLGGAPMALMESLILKPASDSAVKISPFGASSKLLLKKVESFW